MSNFNNMRRDNQDNMRTHDLDMVLEKFARIKSKDNNFSYSFQKGRWYVKIKLFRTVIFLQ